jgi:hypothetical protein
MTPLFAKMNLRDQAVILVLNAPESFEHELAALTGVTIARSAAKVKTIGFALAFVTSQKDVDAAASVFAKKAEGDAIVWFAYPKGTSKKLACEINRDRGWDSMGEAGFERVRAVAIDDDWSALRFRRVEYIKTLTRSGSGALTVQGKARTLHGKGQ